MHKNAKLESNMGWWSRKVRPELVSFYYRFGLDLVFKGFKVIWDNYNKKKFISWAKVKKY